MGILVSYMIRQRRKGLKYVRNSRSIVQLNTLKGTKLQFYVFWYLDSWKEENTIKYSELNVSIYFRSLLCFELYHEYGLVFVTVFPNYIKFAGVSNALAPVNYIPFYYTCIF
jgi:hypothetical protein